MLYSDSWADYALLDAAHGEKIEKWLSYAEQAKVKEQTAEMIQKNLK